MEQVHIRVLDPAVDAERDHILGPADAPVTLVEYGDFECPFCARSYPAVQAIRRQLGDRLRFGAAVLWMALLLSILAYAQISGEAVLAPLEAIGVGAVTE